MRVLELMHVGDAHRHWEAVFQELLARGHEVVFVSLGPHGPLHRAVEQSGGTAIALDIAPPWLPTGLVRLRAVLRSHRVDLIHAHEVVPTIVAGVTRRTGTRVRLAMHRHHASADGRLRYAGKFASALSDAVVGVSEAAARSAVAEGTDPKRVRVALNGVSRPTDAAAAATEMRARLRMPQAPIIVAVARLRREKGIDVLIEATARLDGAHLIVVGDGPEGASLRELAAERLVDRIHFVGQQEDVSVWFELADVVAIPSRREAFGFSAAEAMSYRRPVVASAVGGLPELVVDRVTGRLVRPNDPVKLCHAMSEVIADPHRSSNWANAGFDRYRHLFTVETMVDAWEQCFEWVVGG